ncbi:MAG: nuclear transport factor 2 family protein [Sphingomonadaceae bacterium]
MDSARYQAIREKVVNLYALTGSGNWPEVEKQLTDDFLINEAESLPYGGIYEGKDALERLYTKVFAYWEDASLDVTDITISEDNVVVILSILAKSRHTGERMKMPLCEVLHLRGDLFSGITPYYFDTLAIARATGAL